MAAAVRSIFLLVVCSLLLLSLPSALSSSAKKKKKKRTRSNQPANGGWDLLQLIARIEDAQEMYSLYKTQQALDIYQEITAADTMPMSAQEADLVGQACFQLATIYALGSIDDGLGTNYSLSAHYFQKSLGLLQDAKLKSTAVLMFCNFFLIDPPLFLTSEFEETLNEIASPENHVLHLRAHALYTLGMVAFLEFRDSVGQQLCHSALEVAKAAMDAEQTKHHTVFSWEVFNAAESTVIEAANCIANFQNAGVSDSRERVRDGGAATSSSSVSVTHGEAEVPTLLPLSSDANAPQRAHGNAATEHSMAPDEIVHSVSGSLFPSSASGQKPLLAEAIVNHLNARVRRLLQDSAVKPHEYLDCREQPALYIAVAHRNNEAAKLLVEFGANVHQLVESTGDTPWDVAVKQNSGELVRTLCMSFSFSDPADLTGAQASVEASIRNATSAGHLEVVKAMLECRTRMEQSSVRVDVCGSVAQEGDQLEAAGRGLYSSVHLAAAFGHTKVLEALIDSGNCDAAEVAADGATALSLAAYGGHAAAMQLLLRRTPSLLALPSLTISRPDSDTSAYDNWVRQNSILPETLIDLAQPVAVDPVLASVSGARIGASISLLEFGLHGPTLDKTTPLATSPIVMTLSLLLPSLDTEAQFDDPTDIPTRRPGALLRVLRLMLMRAIPSSDHERVPVLDHVAQILKSSDANLDVVQDAKAAAMHRSIFRLLLVHSLCGEYASDTFVEYNEVTPTSRTQSHINPTASLSCLRIDPSKEAILSLRSLASPDVLDCGSGQKSGHRDLCHSLKLAMAGQLEEEGWSVQLDGADDITRTQCLNETCAGASSERTDAPPVPVTRRTAFSGTEKLDVSHLIQTIRVDKNTVDDLGYPTFSVWTAAIAVGALAVGLLCGVATNQITSLRAGTKTSAAQLSAVQQTQKQTKKKKKNNRDSTAASEVDVMRDLKKFVSSLKANFATPGAPEPSHRLVSAVRSGMQDAKSIVGIPLDGTVADGNAPVAPTMTTHAAGNRVVRQRDLDKLATKHAEHVASLEAAIANLRKHNDTLQGLHARSVERNAGLEQQLEKRTKKCEQQEKQLKEMAAGRAKQANELQTLSKSHSQLTKRHGNLRKLLHEHETKLSYASSTIQTLRFNLKQQKKKKQPQSQPSSPATPVSTQQRAHSQTLTHSVRGRTVAKAKPKQAKQTDTKSKASPGSKSVVLGGQEVGNTPDAIDTLQTPGLGRPKVLDDDTSAAAMLSSIWTNGGTAVNQESSKAQQSWLPSLVNPGALGTLPAGPLQGPTAPFTGATLTSTVFGQNLTGDRKATKSPETPEDWSQAPKAPAKW